MMEGGLNSHHHTRLKGMNQTVKRRVGTGRIMSRGREEEEVPPGLKDAVAQAAMVQGGVGKQ